MKSALAAGLAFLSAGCAATPREFPAFQPVSSREASVRWQRGGKVLAGEAIFSRAADGSARLQLGKNLEPPLLELSLSPRERLDARGSLMAKSWSGQRQDAPLALTAWGAFLNVYLHVGELPPGEKEIHTATERVAYVAENGRLRSLSVMIHDTGEVISGLFR